MLTALYLSYLLLGETPPSNPPPKDDIYYPIPPFPREPLPIPQPVPQPTQSVRLDNFLLDYVNAQLARGLPRTISPSRRPSRKLIHLGTIYTV